MGVLKTENLVKVYETYQKVVALDHVNLSVNKGELLAIMGQSGCGKSTLLHMLGGVDKPTEGKVFVEGKEITNFNESEMAIFRRQRIGIIYQFFNLIDNMTVYKNIIIPVLLDGKEVDKDYFNEIINTVELKDKLKSFPNELSGGQQQRVAIARSLINHPSIILADEPTGNLDRKNSKEVMELLKLINQRLQSTIIVITHDEKVANYCNRIIYMVDGRIEGEN